MTSSSAILAGLESKSTESIAESLTQALQRICRRLNQEKGNDENAPHHQLIKMLDALNEQTPIKEIEALRKYLEALRNTPTNTQTLAELVFEIQMLLTHHWPLNNLDDEEKKIIQDPISLEAITDYSQALPFITGEWILKHNVQRYYNMPNSIHLDERNQLVYRHPVTRAPLSEREIAFLKSKDIRFTHEETSLAEQREAGRRLSLFDAMQLLTQAELLLEARRHLMLRAQDSFNIQDNQYQAARAEWESRHAKYEEAERESSEIHRGYIHMENQFQDEEKQYHGMGAEHRKIKEKYEQVTATHEQAKTQGLDPQGLSEARDIFLTHCTVFIESSNKMDKKREEYLSGLGRVQAMRAKYLQAITHTGVLRAAYFEQDERLKPIRSDFVASCNQVAAFQRAFLEANDMAERIRRVIQLNLSGVLVEALPEVLPLAEPSNAQGGAPSTQPVSGNDHAAQQSVSNEQKQNNHPFFSSAAESNNRDSSSTDETQENGPSQPSGSPTDNNPSAPARFDPQR